VTRRRTFGTTRELASGRWQARYTLDGQRINLDETFTTRKEALGALSTVESNIASGRHVNPTHAKESVGSFARGYFAAKTDWSETTRQDREGLWRRHVGPAFDQRALKDVTPTLVRSWHAGLHRKHATTAQGAYRLLRQVLNAAVADGKLVQNPCKVKGAGVDRSPERHIATVAEVETIVATVPDHMRLLVLLATYAGLRRSELLGLRRADVDVVHRTISVAQTVHHLRAGKGVVVQGPKTNAGRRTVSFPSSVVADVESHLARFVGPQRDALVFTGEKGAPLRPHVLGKAFRVARVAAGRPELTLHDLRHTADTLAAATGATLPELMHRMGHATPHSAMRYLHATKERDAVIAEALADLRPNAAVVPLAEKIGHAEGTKSDGPSTGSAKEAG
jgi:integrase